MGDRYGGSCSSSCSTDLIPLPHAVVFLEKSLVMGDAVLAVDEARIEA